ncbi:hypothetical protein NUH30_09510 [Leptospira sp. 85282-16]|uniref:Uncharacterized protein n=1 Tax=Leptospira montravelensis TaxID=2484961 RepID=A0ABY2LMU2_9LEPT|nr:MULTISPECIES: hypothetical protein [Leptospira]MCT8333909.1 hypothetical protein [Leptospira sp. 85282-16]TGK80309.1 hypothetical protein EHQ19_11510 [Leptospira montravelensis]TGL00480.1 hypothetical protein EHQ31_16935 [Leptospira montravelensis]
MSELNTKADQLKRQADLMGLTREAVFTDEQAKEVLQGKITDGYLVKVKIDLDSLNGMVLILVSSIRKHIMELYAVIGTSPTFRRIRTFADHVQISTDLGDIGKTGGYDPAISENIGRAVHRAFTKEKLEELLPLWQKKDPSHISELLENPILMATKGRNIKLQAEVDKLSTAKFRYENPMKGIILPIPKPEDEAAAAQEVSVPGISTEPAKGELSSLERQIAQYRTSFPKELNMKTVISPINGVEFDNLVEGMEILFRVPTETPEGLTNAQILGLIDEEGKISKDPVVGKFLGIAGNKSEYHIFAEGPNRYLLHSIEEHPVKVAIPKPTSMTGGTNKGSAGQNAKKKVGNAQAQESKSSGTNLFMLMGAFVTIVLFGVLLFVMVIL